MAKFALYLIKNKQRIPLTIFNGKEFSGSKTFEERFSEAEHSKKTLSFSILQYKDGLLDPVAAQIFNGAEVELVDKNENYHRLYINKIDYKIFEKNVQMDISAIDSFQYELQKQNIGYTITDDVTREDFLGAITLDSWAKKIKADCRITWDYEDVDTRNYRAIQLDPAHETFNTLRTFSISGSNAYLALVELANLYGMNIVTDDLNKVFGFEPSKNLRFNGLYFSPDFNLKDLDITTDAQALTTVMQVTGPEDVFGYEITLVPEIPPVVKKYIESADWSTSSYHPAMYSDLYAPTDTKTTTDLNFLELINYTPWFENKLIDFSYFSDGGFLNPSEVSDIWDTLYNKLRITNGRLILESSKYWQKYREKVEYKTDLEIATQNLQSEWYSGINEYLEKFGQPDFNLLEGFGQYLLRREELLAFEGQNILERNKMLTYYANSRAALRQVFYENIFNFRSFLTQNTYDVSLNNLQYYIANKDSIDPQEARNCAVIAGTLTDYWGVAKNAGMYVGYYLMDSWDCVDKLLSDPPPAELEGYYPLINLGGVLGINDDAIPQVSLFECVLPQTNTGFDNKTFAVVKWKYGEQDEYSGAYVRATEIVGGYYTNPQGQKYFIEIPEEYITIGDLSNTFFLLIPSQTERKYQVDGLSNITYNARTPDPSLLGCGGIYEKAFEAVKECAEYNDNSYKTLLEEQKQHWDYLRIKYPFVLLESLYTDTSATTSKILYENAQNTFKELAQPEPTYNISILDSDIVNTYQIEIKYSDQIRISQYLLEDEQTELKKLLSGILFVTEISRTLRDDTSLSVNVNRIKYTDILIGRLARVL